MTGILEPHPFAQHANSGCPPPAALAISLAAEFTQFDARATHEKLELLADRASWSPDDALEQLRLIGEIARSDAMPAIGERGDPAASLLPTALSGARADADVAAVILCEVARRLGWRVGIVGNAQRLYIAHTELSQPILLDPAIGELIDADAVAQPRRWRCAHEVSGHLLANLERVMARHGRITDAIRAAELRCELPLDSDSRFRAERRLASARSRLN